MNWKIAVPSYRRPDRLETPETLREIEVYIDPEEEAEYRERNPGVRFHVCPDGVQGNISRVRNYILDANEDADCVVTVDDDFRELSEWQNGVRDRLGEEEIYEFIEHYSFVAWELGVYLWGVNVNCDRQGYQECTPFSLTAYIGAPFQAVMKGCELRYDERLPLKEDYDFTLQHLNRYRKVFRVNNVFYTVRQTEQPGGCATYRSMKTEREQMGLLQRKWGKRIVRESDRHNVARSRRREKAAQINPILHIPIKGP